VGTQAALSVGIILVVLSVLNLGQLIFYVAHPVMSGFTTGAAMIIGLQQLKSAFGFSNSPPQTGQTGFDYNYQVFQWFADHWYDETSYRVTKTSPYHNYPVRDFLSVHMAFGLFVPLLIIKVLQNRISKISSDETKGTFIYKFYHFVSNISPFIGLIIATNITWQIYTNANDSNSTLNNYYIKNLTIVGSVQAGFNFLGNPALPYPFWQFLGDCIPITFVAYMEGYGVAQRIARQKNELHLLNASQEMWAVGVSNLLGSVSGAFPVTGSFSRSSLNAVAGARTPFSKTTTLFVILTALGTLTPTFFFIPNAALAAIIWVAIWPLINFVDIWNAWRYSKKDFFLIILTFGLEFVFNTEIGLAVGLSTSLLIFVLDTTFNPSTQIHVVSSGKENNGVDIVKFEGSEFTFLNSTRVKNFIIELSYLAPKKPDPNNLNRVIFYNVSQTLDKVLRPDLLVPVDTLPKAIVVDFHSIRIVDITALIGLAEVVHETASRGVSLVLINIHPSVIDYFTKYKIKNQVFDPSISDVDLSQYLKHSDLEVEHIGHDEYALRFPQIYKDNHDAEAGGTNKGSGRGI
jgi:MFS superfamily sulfate permease-like transporter